MKRTTANLKHAQLTRSARRKALSVIFVLESARRNAHVWETVTALKKKFALITFVLPIQEGAAQTKIALRAHGVMKLPVCHAGKACVLPVRKIVNVEVGKTAA